MRITKLTPNYNIRWESSRIMLPEHIEALKKHKEESRKVDPPLLDEQELQEIGIIVMDALHHTLDLKVTYWQDGYYNQVMGTVDKVDYQEKWIRIVSDTEIKRIPIKYLKIVERV